MMLGLRTFLKNKKTLNISIAGVVSSVIFLLLVSPVYAGIGGDIAGGVIALFNTLLYVILQTIVYALITAVGILINIGQYPVALDDNIITVGWVVLRDIGNMFFVVALLLISFGTILRLDQYQLKNLLPKVILMAVLVNFSKLIAGVFIEISQIVMLTFVVAYSAAGAGNFMNAMQIPNLTQIWTPSDITNVNTAKPLEHADVFTSLVGGIIYAAIAVVVVLAYIAIFAVRLVALWILVVFSPFAFALNVIPAGQKYASMWWEQFSKYIIVGPVLAFFLWLSLATLPMILDQSGSNNAGTRGQDEIAYIQSIEKNIPGAGSTEALQPVSFLKFILSSVMLIMSLYFAQQIGGTVGNIARMGMSSLSTLGKNAGGLRPLLRYANERQAEYTRFSANPYTYIDAWRKQRDIRRSERMKEAEGFASDMAKFGYLRSAKAAVGGIGGEVSWRKAIEDGIAEAKKQAEDIQLQLTVGTGQHVEEQIEKFKAEHAAALANVKASEERIKNLNELKDLTTTIEAGGTLDDKKEKRLEFLRGNFGELTVEQISERLLEEDKQKSELENKSTETEQRTTWSKAVVGEYLVNESKQKQRQQKVIEDALTKGGMTVDEVDASIATVTSSILQLQEVISNLDLNSQNHDAEDEKYGQLLEKLQGLETYRTALQAYDEKGIDITLEDTEKAIATLDNAVSGGTATDKQLAQLDILKRRKLALDSYQTALTRNGGEFYNAFAEGMDLITDEMFKDVKTALDPDKIKKEIDTAKREQEKSEIIIQGKAVSENARVDLEKRLKDTQKAMRQGEVNLAKLTIPHFYREQARRSLIGDKLKEVQSNDSNELIREFRLAQASGDQYKMGAVVHKLANDANTNEILHSFGYSSNFDGFKQFYEEQVRPYYTNEEDMLRLAMDVSYVNESRNHWDVARVVNVDQQTGRLRWNSIDEHVAEVLAEIAKMNPQKVKREFNRLAYGGEIEINGKRVFVTQKLAIELMKQQKDNLMDAAKFGGDLQKNAAAKLYEGLRNMSPAEVRQHGLDDLMERLGAYVAGTVKQKG